MQDVNSTISDLAVSVLVVEEMFLFFSFPEAFAIPPQKYRALCDFTRFPEFASSITV